MAKPATLLNSFTVEGNGLSGDQTLLLSVVELQIQKILNNPNYLAFQRLAATATQFTDLGGAGVAVYRIASRAVMGTDFNELTGVQKQIGKAITSTLYLNQQLTVDFMFPRNDLERLKKNPDLAGQLVAEWQASLVLNKFMELELIMLNAIKQYHIWRWQFDKKSILVLDFSKIVDQKSAEDAFYQIGDYMIDKTRQITEHEIGTNPTDWTIFFGPKEWLKLTRVYTKLIAGDIIAGVYATGDLYRDQILGTYVGKHLFLGQSYMAGTDTAMNKDISWNLEGLLGFAVHPQNLAFPMSFEYSTMALDNDSFNLRWHSRIMFGLPEFIRGNLGFIILDHEPTADEIAWANQVVAPDWATQGQDNYGDNLEYAFQLSIQDRALKDSVNEDGSRNLALNMTRGKTDESYVIGQAMGKLGLHSGDWIIVANADPAKTPDTKLTDADIKAIAATDWKAILVGTTYFMLVLHKNATNDYTVLRTEKVKIVNDPGTTLGSKWKPNDENK